MAEAKDKSTFDTLNPIDVSAKTEKKNGFNYLSWAWAWGEVKKRFPNANFRIIRNEQGWIYHTDNRTGWVEVEVTINDLTHTEILPVMDYKNNSIPVDKITSFDANKAVHRCLVKCLALHGLGLYIYAGEDLPETPEEEISEENASEKPQKASKTAKKTQEVKQPIQELPSDYCTICRLPVTDWDGKMKSGDPVHYSKEDIISRSTTAYGSPVCMSCMMKKTAKAKQNKEVSNE